ncbi:MAG: antibiotic biosynthesis monooxygenase [Balneolaceae bacterium]
MIARIWHGWTTPENATQYYQTLTGSVIPGIKEMNIKGFKKMDILRKDLAEEVEFITIMYFHSIESIKDFTGEDYETAHIPEEAQRLLERWDLKASHYEFLDSIHS